MIDLNLPDANVLYYPRVFSEDKSWQYFNSIFKEIMWQHDPITLFGKTYMQPRLTALYAENENPYSYSNITMKPHFFTPDLLAIKSKIETLTQERYTSCLLNLYRDGNDSNGWHADNEKELGENPVIASVSFGAERIFHLKHRTLPNIKHKLILQHGSLLLMKGTTQHNWLHQLPKTNKKIGKRINLTFRYIK